MKLHEKILSLRRKAGLTQEKLGTMLNVSPQAVSKWENEESLPDVVLIPALCAALHVSADELLDVPAQAAAGNGTALVCAGQIRISSQMGLSLAVTGEDAVRAVQHTDVSAVRELLALLGDDEALRIFRALSFAAIGFEAEIAAACGLTQEQTQAALFRLLKKEIIQCAPEGYVPGSNAYLVFAALAAAWLASPEGRADVGQITVTYST